MQPNDASIRPDSSSFDHYLELLGSTQIDVQVAAANALVAMGEPIIDRLITLIERDPMALGGYPILTLGRIGGSRSFDALLILVKNALPSVRATAIAALSNFNSSQVIDLCIEILRYDSDSECRSYAADALGHLKAAQAIDALIDSLYDTDYQVRADGAWALGEIGDSRALPELKRVRNVNDYIAQSADEAIEKIEREHSM